MFPRFPAPNPKRPSVSIYAKWYIEVVHNTRIQHFRAEIGVNMRSGIRTPASYQHHARTNITHINITCILKATPFKMSRTLEFLHFDADAFAQQLTIVAANIYGQITAVECEAWQSLSKRSSTPEQTPHINAMIRHHNEVWLWALDMITTPTDRKEQVQVMNHLVAIADECRTLNNFATLTSIISAMSDETAERVSRSIYAPAQSKLMKLQALVTPARGFIEYRQAVRLAALPCVPCLGSSAHPGLTDCSSLIGFSI